MIRIAAVSTLAFALSLAALGVTYAQNETTTPSPTVNVAPTEDATVPQGAPQTGFGGF